MPRRIRGGRVAALVAAALVAHAGALAAQGRVVRAVVRDSLTARALAGVTVTAGRRTVMTDTAGRFAVEVTDDSVRVTVGRPGYRALVLRADAVPDALLLARAPAMLTSLFVTAAPAHDVGAGTQLGLATTDGVTLRSVGTTTVAEAMETTEGVSTSRPGSWGTKAYLHGLGGERVAVLLDGNRVNRACNVGMDAGLATINPDNVERVEVLAGPGSALYGSGNIGGVINVVTRGPREGRPVQGEVRLTGSTAVPGARVGGSLWYRQGRLALAAAANGASYGDYRTPTGTVAGSSLRDLTLDLTGTYGLGTPHRLDARAQRYAGRDIGYPGSGDATIPEEDRLLLALDYGWQHGAGVLDGVTAKVYAQGVDHFMVMRMTRPPAMPGGMAMEMQTDAVSATDTWGARAQARLRPHRLATLDAGAEVTRLGAEGTRWIERRTMVDTTTMTMRTWPGVHVTDIGAFAQASASLTPWLDAAAGGRFDVVRRGAEDSAGTSEEIPSGNVGLRAAFAGGAFARASLGFGYRVPDPTELYGLLLRPDGFLYLGNPALETETSRNVEISLGWDGPGLDVSATAYRNTIAGYITPVVNGDSVGGMPVRQYANVSDARIEGVTASLSATVTRWLLLRGSAALTRGRDRTADRPLPMIPPLEGTLGARFVPARLPWIEAEMVAASRQDDPAMGEIATAGFAVVNLRAGLTLGRTAVTVGIENLLDHAYRRHLDPQALLRPGRNLYLRLIREL